MAAVLVPPHHLPNLTAARHPAAVRDAELAMPWAALIGGSSGDPGAQYRDPALRDACVNDKLSYHGRMRIATAGALLKLRCAALRGPCAAFRLRANPGRPFCAVRTWRRP